MHQIQHANASERLCNRMRQNTCPTLGIHRPEPAKDVIQLCQTIDQDEHVRHLQHLRVPEEHPSPDADVAKGIVRHEIGDEVELLSLTGLLGVEFPEEVQPRELEELLGREEAGDEEGLRRPEGDVAVVDVFHVGGGEHAVLLGGEVVEEGCGCL